MDIPLPEESQPPGLHDGQGSSGFPQCDNIPLPSCGLQFNTAAIPPPIPPAALPIAAPVLPPEAALPQQTSEAIVEQADDPNRYSPSRATAEDDIPITPPPPKSEPPRAHSFGPKTTVLGKAQAKKRLLAFSMTKQGGGAGLSFGFQKKMVPKVNTGSAKVFAGTAVDDDGIQEAKDAAVKQEKQVSQVKKKSSKKGLTRDDKARAVVSAIEEIKREELMLRGVIAYGSLDLKTAAGDMTAPVPLLGQPLGMPLKPKDEFDLSGNPLLEQQKGAIESLLDSLLSQSDKHNNDKGAVNSEAEADGGRSERHDGGRRKEDRKKDSDRGTSSRRRASGRERRRSKERHSRSGKDRHKDEKRSRAAPTELPMNWTQFRLGGYRIEEIRRLKLKLDDRDLGGSSSGSRSRDKHRRRSRDRRSRSREDKKHRKSPARDAYKECKTEEELEYLYRPFDGPSRLRFPLVITNPTQMIIEYPRSFVRYTRTRPPVSFCESPDSTSAQFRSRAEVFGDATSEMVETMKEIINSKQKEELIQIKREPDENLSSSLAALQVSYDEAEVGGSPSSPENVTDGRRKERSWYHEKDYILSTEHEDKDENSITETEIVIKNEKEDLEMDRENVTDRKLSVDVMDVVENDHQTLSNNEQVKEKTPQMQSPDVAVGVPNTERTTVRSKWDSDYEEDMMSAEETHLDVTGKESFNCELEDSSKLTGPDYLAEESKNRGTGEYDKSSDTQGEEQLLQDEKGQNSRMEEQKKKAHLEEGSKVTEETKEDGDDEGSEGGGDSDDDDDDDDDDDEDGGGDDDDDDDDDEEEEGGKEEGGGDGKDADVKDMHGNEYTLQTDELNKENLACAETSSEGNTDQKLVSEYEEFMKAVSSETIAADEQVDSGDEPCQQLESAESDREASEGDIFERRQMELSVNDTWDEDSKEGMESKEDTVNTDFMLQEEVIRKGRESSSKKKKKQDSRPRSSSSSSEEEEEEENLKIKKHEKRRKSSRETEKKMGSRRKSYTSDGSSSSDDSSSSSSEEDTREKRKHVRKRGKARKNSEDVSDDELMEICEKINSEHKKASRRKKKYFHRKKQQRKRNKRRKVETSSSSDDSSDSDESSSSSSERGRKRHKNKESRGYRKNDEDSSSEDSSSSSSSDSSSSSSSSHGKRSKRRRRKNSKKAKKEARRKRKERSRKRKKRYRHSTSGEMEKSGKSKISKSSQKGEGSHRLSGSRHLNNRDDTISLEELEAQIVKVRHQDGGDMSARHLGNSSDADNEQKKRNRKIMKENRRALTLECSNSNISRDCKVQSQGENEENQKENSGMFVSNDVSSSGESCWEESHRPKRKRDKITEDSHERVMNNDTVEIGEEGEVEKRKILKKRRRDRCSRSASPLNDFSRKRRRSPSTSPEHSPTPQRRSSSDAKDKGHKESATSRNQTDSGCNLKHGDGDGRKRGHSQGDMELDPTDFVDQSGIRNHSFMEEMDHSGFESYTDDMFEGFKTKQTEVTLALDPVMDQSGFESYTDDMFEGFKTKQTEVTLDDNRIKYITSQDFSSSGEDHGKENRHTEDFVGRNENKVNRRHGLRQSDCEVVDKSFERERGDFEKDSSSPMLRKTGQEILGEDREFTGEDRGDEPLAECGKDNKPRIKHENCKNFNTETNEDCCDCFSFSSSIEKKQMQKLSHRVADYEESDSIYSPGDPFESRLNSDSVKKNVSDYIDSSSQDSKVADSYPCDMSLDSLCSPPCSVEEPEAVIHNEHSCRISPSVLGNLKVTGQWSGYSSKSRGSSSKGDIPQIDSFMSLENIPLPPPASQSEGNENKRQHGFEHNEKSHEILPPLPSTVAPQVGSSSIISSSTSSTSNSSFSEDIGGHVTTSDNDTKASASQPLETLLGLRKPLGKPPMQKHVITVKLLSPLARLQSASESKSSHYETSDIQAQAIVSNEIADSSHRSVEIESRIENKQEHYKSIKSVSHKEDSASNEVNKSSETESKIQIKHPWTSFSFSFKGDGSNLTLYDDILESNAAEEQVSSTTVKPVQEVDKQEKGQSSEAVAKERTRKRPSRWGMMTAPIKCVTEDMQQDDAVTSQQKCDTNHNHSVAAVAGSSCSEGNKESYNYKQHIVLAEPKSEDILNRRKFSEECGMDLGSSQSENTRKDDRDSDNCKIFTDRHSRDVDRRDRRDKGKERDREIARDESEDRDISKKVRGEDMETNSSQLEERDKDNRLEESSNERENRDSKRGETTNYMESERQDCEQRQKYKDCDNSNVEPHDRKSISDSQLSSDYKTDWEDGGENSHDKREIMRSDLGWGDSGDCIPRLNSAADPPWESRVVRYRSQSRSLSPEFRGWEDQPASRITEDDQDISRLDEQRYMGHPRLSLERLDSAEDDRVRENNTVRNSSRDCERMRESSRDRMGGGSRDRLRESSRDRDRIRESNRDHDRMRDNIKDHDRLRESNRDPERMKMSSRDRSRLRDNSRDRDRLRENSRDRERLRDSNRDMDRIRSSSRDQDRMRDNSRDRERIRERQEDRERRDERCIRDRWNVDLDRSRDRERERRGDRHWEKVRRERKKDDRSRERDRDRGRWSERRSRSPIGEDPREHESTTPGYYILDIPLPVTTDGESWGPSTGVGSGEADMELSCSPASSPLVGFKRSLADSTISDSELVAAAGKQEEHNPSSPFQQCSGYYNTDCYPQTREECTASPTVSPSFSPKRISLDDRIELELGVKKSPPPLPPTPQQIPVYHQHQSYATPYAGFQGGSYYPIPPPQPHYESSPVTLSGSEKFMPGHHYMHPCEEFSGPPQHEALLLHHKQFIGRPPEEKYGPIVPKRRPPLLPTPSNIAPDMSHWDSPEAFIGAQEVHKMLVTPEHGRPVMVASETFMGTQQMGGSSHVVQVGNVLQVVPTDLPPGSVLGTLPPPPPPAQQSQAHKSVVLQSGNVLQVIPSENLPVPNVGGSGGTQVFQVGNMLQVIPGASPSPAPHQPVVVNPAKVTIAHPPPTPQSGIQTHGTAEMSKGHSPIAKVPPSPRHALPIIPGPLLPLPATPANPIITVDTTSGAFPPQPVPASGYSPPASPFLISEPQPPLLSAEMVPLVVEAPIPFLSPSESPREEAERRREERERRRQEKEKRRLEKEKRRQIKLKHAADNLIKKALQQEGEQTDIDLEEMRLIEEAMRQVPDCEDEPAPEVPPVTPPKKKRRTPVQVKPLPPAGKGILISPGFREKSVSGENEGRKSVKFADGVRPGEGTSPSAGEDLPSPPPPPRKLPKEKRFKKRKKKKIKVKIIRQINVEDDDDDDDDDISPPPPPPGSPPPPPVYPPAFPAGYPPSGYVYSQPATYTVLPGTEGGATASAGSATVFTPMYHQHHHSTTTTTTTVQFAPPPPPPSPHTYPPTGKQRKTK